MNDIYYNSEEKEKVNSYIGKEIVCIEDITFEVGSMPFFISFKKGEEYTLTNVDWSFNGLFNYISMIQVRPKNMLTSIPFDKKWYPKHFIIKTKAEWRKEKINTILKNKDVKNR